MSSEDGDAPLRSAVELAMERLRQKDEREGVESPRALTEAQKAAIAEVRRRYEAKIAETKILQAGSLRKAVEAGDPEKLVRTEEEHRTELAALESKREEEIAAIRGESD